MPITSAFINGKELSLIHKKYITKQETPDELLDKPLDTSINLDVINNSSNCELDNQTIVSNITENNTILSSDLIQKQDELNIKTELELNKLTMDGLKEKCKENGIVGVSKFKKPELVKILLDEFIKLFSFIKDKKAADLKTICKNINVKGFTGIKKDDIILLILTYCSSNLNFKINKTVIPEIIKDIEASKQTTNEPKISLKKELEKQKIEIEIEIELKMKEELEKQKILIELEKQKIEKQKIEIELKIKEELEKQKILIELKMKEEELEKQKILKELKMKEELEKQKEDIKKRKQSIPKNVRIIIWNHYIGEDIIKHRCLCCKKVVICNTNFDVGHVISEKNGGTHEINNLRPICFACNHSMGTENMIEFVVKYGLYIG